MEQGISLAREFSVKHKEFYAEFDKWKREILSKNVPTNGVYILKANRSISRFLGTDKDGILYIGKGNVLGTNHRVGKFINSINQTEDKHSGGLRFDGKAKKRYPIEYCTITIKLVKDSSIEESKLLTKYKQEFGELPPLNRILT